MKLAFLLVILSVTFISGCKTTAPVTQSAKSHVVNNVVITEPVAIDYKSELAIARLTQVINTEKVEPKKLAQLYYDRGVIYDSLGLRSLAHLDFRKTLELEPAHADAYNFIGIHMTLLESYTRAFNAFDSALEINPDHNYVHLNRGIALNYYGRKDLSVTDLETFYLKNIADPYRVIWLYLVEHQVSAEDAKMRLAFNAKNLNPDNWNYQIVNLYLGKVSEQAFIASMLKNVKNGRMLADRLCEGYFYLGKLKLMQGDTIAAKNYFRLALATNVYEFVEHKYARLELNMLYMADRQAIEAKSQGAKAQ